MPIPNYSFDVESPIKRALQGFQQGRVRRQEDQQFQQKQQAAQQRQDDLFAVADLENPTPQDFAQLMIKYPEDAAKIKQSYDLLNDDQRQNSIQDLSSVDSALRSGDTDSALSLLKERQTAAENSGDEGEIAATTAMINQIETSPKAARFATGAALTALMGPTEYANYVDKTQVTKGRLKESSQKDTKLIQDLRVEFVKNEIVKKGALVNTAVDKMDAIWKNHVSKGKSAKTKGALDQALVTTFNKMLDPGSVVRESEFARSTEGQSMINKAAGFFQRLEGGGVGLTDDEREEFVKISKVLQKAHHQQVMTKIDFANKEAVAAGFDPARITGSYKIPVFDDEEEVTAPGQVPTTAAPADADIDAILKLYPPN